MTLDSALENNDEWTDFETAYQQYQVYKAAGLNTKIQIREIMFGALKEHDIETIRKSEMK